MRCPECGSTDIDTNTHEAWCYSCDRRWADTGPDAEVYERLRAADLEHRGSISEDMVKQFIEQQQGRS